MKKKFEYLKYNSEVTTKTTETDNNAVVLFFFNRLPRNQVKTVRAITKIPDLISRWKI